MARVGDQFRERAQMSLGLAMRRNRFKNPPSAKKSWALPKFMTEWRLHARRAALLLLLTGALSILIWALDRPVRVISMDGSFQRVSPGQIEKAVAPYRARRLHVRELKRHSARGRGVALGGPCAHRAPLAEQSARRRDRADRGGALGRVRSPEYPRRAVRQSRRACARGAAALKWS